MGAPTGPREGHASTLVGRRVSPEEPAGEDVLIATEAHPGRLGGVLLVGATLVMSVGAAIPFFAPSLRDAPWSDVWDELAAGIAGNPSAWVWANALFLAAAVLTLLGLVVLSARFERAARIYGLMAVASFGLAAALSVMDRIISISVATWAAQEGLGSDDLTVQAFIRMDEGFSLWFFLLGFFSVVLVGVAMVMTAGEASKGRWVVGAGVVGLVVALIGFAIPAFVYLSTAAIGVLCISGDRGAESSVG